MSPNSKEQLILQDNKDHLTIATAQQGKYFILKKRATVEKYNTIK